MLRRTVCVLAALGLLAGVAAAQDWSEDFESFNAGQEPCGNRGWEEWDGSNNVCGVISDKFANSGTKSLELWGFDNRGGQEPLGDDTVQQFRIADGGQWTMSVMTYMPSSAEGLGWVIMLNRYPNNKNWSMQVNFNADFDVVENGGFQTFGETDLIRDKWVEFRVEIDLTADTADYFYNDIMFLDNTATWTEEVSGNGDLAIQALDLYADEPTRDGVKGFFLDDPSLTAGGGGPCEPCDTNCDGSVDLTDVESFIGLLTEEVEQCDPGCSGDTNNDGSVDLTDVEGFIECLLG